MKLFLVLSALLGCTAAISIDIDFDERTGVLTIWVPDDGLRRIRGVNFVYYINEKTYRKNGVLVGNRWQYTTSNIARDEYIVRAYARVFKYIGGVEYTVTASQRLWDPRNQQRMINPGRSMREVVVFRDDFSTLDLNNWRHEVSMYGGMNWEFQAYTNDPKNTYVKDGKLYIMPTLTVDDSRFSAPHYLTTGKMDMISLFGTCTNAARAGCMREGNNGLLPPVMSGKLKSVPTIRYGSVEIRARIPTGDWIWPAMWMLPEDDEYGAWPRSGEIDIMESRGTKGSYGVGGVSSTLHWGPSFSQNSFPKTTGVQYSKSWAEDFHTWKLEWSPSYLRTTVDGKQVLRVDVEDGFWKRGGYDGNNLWSSGDKMAPFDKDFYMIFNVAVGGTNGFFPDDEDYGGAKKPWKNNATDAPADFWNARQKWLQTWNGDKAAMIIDYIEMKQF